MSETTTTTTAIAAPRSVRCYDYVNRTYDEVRRALLDDPAEVFRRATSSATTRAAAVHAALHVRIGAMDVSRDVDIRVADVEETTLYRSPATRMTIEWRAAQNAQLFPTVRGTLSIYPLSSTETQLDLDAHYKPPLGAIGGFVDDVAGHRLAEAAVLRFVQEVAAFLRDNRDERAE